MRHQNRKKKIGTDSTHKKAILKNLAMSLIINEKVKTTSAKAKLMQPLVENLITIAKTKDKVTAIRQIDKKIQHKDASKKIFEQLLEKYADKKSGYTRATKVGFRAGDNAPMVLVELV